MPVLCKGTQNVAACQGYVSDALFCLELNQKSHKMAGAEAAQEHCQSIDRSMPDISSLIQILAEPRSHKEQTALLQQMARVQTWARSEVAAPKAAHRHRTAFLQTSE